MSGCVSRGLAAAREAVETRPGARRPRGTAHGAERGSPAPATFRSGVTGRSRVGGGEGGAGGAPVQGENAAAFPERAGLLRPALPRDKMATRD